MDIRFDEAGLSFAAQVALQPLTLELGEHRIGAIGLNGSGKTSFARLVNGLAKPSTGRVTLDGLDTVADAKRLAGRVGFVFQNPANQIILPHVAEDVALGLKGRGLAAQEIAARVEQVLERLGIGALSARRSHELSGGELQLAALAGLLVTEPELLILDEPTNQLDLRNRARVRDSVAALSQQVIVISHDLDFIGDFDRVLLFHEGRVLADGPAGDVIARYLALCGR